MLLLVKEQVDPDSPGVIIDSVSATCHPGPLAFPLLRIWTASLNRKQNVALLNEVYVIVPISQTGKLGAPGDGEMTMALETAGILQERDT